MHLDTFAEQLQLATFLPFLIIVNCSLSYIESLLEKEVHVCTE